MKRIVQTAIMTLAVACGAPALADHHADAEAMSASPALQAVLDHERRNEDRSRDDSRNPLETLAFFDVQPDHSIVEYSPGSGWYTRILAPYVAGQGKYIAVNWGPYESVPERYRSMTADWPESFPAKASEFSGVSADRIAAYFGNNVPEALNGTVDRILIVRMLHNMLRWGIADSELMAMRRLLKDDGMIGIVQHEAPEGASYGMTDGSKGYLKKSTVIAMMELCGFELAGESFVNANPADSADYPDGVWTLPPSLRLGDEDRERYAAIGESNRMTLLFRKAE